MLKFFTHTLLLTIGLVVSSLCYGNERDSLHQIYNNKSLPDTVRMNALAEFIWTEYLFSSPDSVIYYGKEYLDNALETGRAKRIKHGYNLLGTGYYFLGDLDKALFNYQKMGEFTDLVNDKQGKAVYLGNLANIYFYQEEYEKSLEHYKIVADLFLEMGNDRNAATTYNNMGNIYVKLDDYDNAYNYYKESEALRKKDNDSIGLSSTYSDIAIVLLEKGERKEALNYFREGMRMAKSINCIDCLANAYKGLATFYNKSNNYDSSLYYLNNCYEFISEQNLVLQKVDILKLLYETNRKKKDYQSALAFYEEYVNLQDSLNNDKHRQEVMLQDIEMSYKIKAAEDSIKTVEANHIRDLELEAEQAKNARKTQQTYFLILGLLVALILGGIAYNRFRIARKQKGIIEKQKEAVDMAYLQLGVKNNEILDSIQYAKRIQNAILPSKKLIKELLPDSFILYLPKDIVAGDFYWLEEKNGTILFAVADCTGHGVPGAMVSVICNNGLNRSVREHGFISPNEVLNKTRTIVLSEFDKSEEQVRDGMDIGLCALQNEVLSFAGAQNSLWVIRKGKLEIEDFEGDINGDCRIMYSNDEGYTLLEIKADKQPIGRFAKQKPFTNHKVKLIKGDVVYLYSDGYADQFGGAKGVGSYKKDGKKFKSVNLKHLILSIQEASMSEQKKRLEEVFHNWRDDLEQVDDVCIMGVKF